MVLNIFRSILKSLELDYPPKSCTDSATRGQLCDPCQQLEAVDAKLYAQLEEVEQLLRIRAEAKGRLNRHHDYVTCRLPAEITSHIFAIYTEDHNSNFDSLPPIGGPLVLGAVSKSWREIAFATPRLWNTVNIIIPDDNLPTKVLLTKQWLDRSRQLPLYISLFPKFSDDEEKVEPDPDSEALIPLFDVLRNVAPRWCKLVLEISPLLYSTFLGELTCAPTLDTLKLLNCKPADREFRLHTPSLKHLHIFLIPFPKIFIDWGNLVTIESDVIFRGEFFEVLRLVERLDSFRLDGFTWGRPELYPLPTTPLKHSGLRQLYFGMDERVAVGPSQLENLLDLVAFPSLQKFEYGSFHRTYFPKTALQSLFRRSHCPLTHFHLVGHLEAATSSNLIAILSDLPTITHLKWEDNSKQHRQEPTISDELLRRLTPTLCSEDTHNRLLPRLESLEYRGHKTFSWNSLANLGNATKSIRQIIFGVYHGPGTDYIDADSNFLFQGACDTGMLIIIMNENPRRLIWPKIAVPPCR